MVKMNRYVKLALVGFAASSLLSFILRLVVTHGPWEDQQATIMMVYLSLSGAYIACCSAFLSDLLSGQHKWATSPLKRVLSVFLAGASLGFFLLSWTAILGPNDLKFLYTHDFQLFLHGHGSEPAWLQARELVPKAELLSTCKMIVENCVQYTLFSAALTIADLWIYSILYRWRLPVIVLFILRFLIPMLVIMRIFLLSVSPPKYNFF
jgi:hypothetical protein